MRRARSHPRFSTYRDQSPRRRMRAQRRRWRTRAPLRVRAPRVRADAHSPRKQSVPERAAGRRATEWKAPPPRARVRKWRVRSSNGVLQECREAILLRIAGRACNLLAALEYHDGALLSDAEGALQGFLRV